MNPSRLAARATAWLARLDHVELRWCIAFNRQVRLAGLRRLFQAASRLGDGVAWYCLVALLAAFAGHEGLTAALRMAIAGLSGLLLYRQLKHRLVRERPFITHRAITRAGAPLDRFSFPSGHTLHAVSFTLLACDAFPLLAWALVPFAALVALSRVVLGLHYPSDVAAGALLGFGVANAAAWLPLP